MNSKKKSVKIIAIIIFSFFMFLSFIYGINKPHILPFGGAFHFDYLKDICFNGKVGVAIDKQGERIVIFNENKEITKLLDCNISGSLIDKAYDVCVDDNTVHIMGIKTFNKGNYINAEYIISYNTNNGKYEKNLLKEYSENDFVTKRKYNNIEEIIPTAKSIDVSNITQLAYSFGFAMSNIIFYVSILYLIFITCYLIYYYFKYKYKPKDLLVVVSIISIVLISLYFTINARKLIQKENDNNINVQSKQIASIVKNFVHKDSTITREDCNNLLTSFAKAYGINSSYYYNCYSINENYELTAFIDSREEFEQGEKIYIDENIIDTLKKGENVYNVKKEDVDSITVCNYTILKNENDTPFAILEIGYSKKNLLSYQITYCIDLLVKLIIILIVILVSFSAYVEIKKSLIHLFSREKNDYSGKMLDAGVSYKFLMTILTNIDSVILVLVAKSLCEDLDPAIQAIMIALPITAVSLGSTIGTVIFNFLILRVGKRTMSIFASIAIIIILFFTIFSISISNIIIFTICKFFFGLINTGFIYSLSTLMPLQATTQEERNKSYDINTQVGNAGSILSIIIGGYISEYLSFSIIYVFGIVITILIFAVSILAFSNTRINTDSDTKTSSKQQYIDSWKFVFSKNMIVLLMLFVFARCLLKGYSSYLFPLYTASAGLTLVLLSNLSAMSKAFTYAVNGFVRDLLKPFDQNLVMILESLFVSFCFICFLISPNIYWAIFVLFINELIYRLSSPILSSYQNERIIEAEVDLEQTNSNLNIVKSAQNVLQTPILSFFVSLGYNYACAALGALTAVMFGLFGLINKDTLFTNKHEKNNKKND